MTSSMPAPHAAPGAPPTWPGLLTSLLAGQDLTSADTAWAMGQVMNAEATPVQVAGFLVALRAKGETVGEVRGLAEEMLRHAVRIEVAEPSLDIVGTGGDRAHTVNISTMSAIVAAGAGVRVVKHGNRAASSSSGAADVLEALGVDLTRSADRVQAAAAECGITFCFAQMFHPALRHAAAARSQLGIGTAFNFMGPLTNPAQPTYAAVGVADARVAPLLAGVLAGWGKQAVVVRGDDGLDEVTVSTTTSIWWVGGGAVHALSLDPRRLGLHLQPLEALRGGDAARNAEVARRLLRGERGAVRDAVLLNAGIALALADPDRSPDAPGIDQEALHEVVRAGMAKAAAAIDSGAADLVLQRWVQATSA